MNEQKHLQFIMDKTCNENNVIVPKKFKRKYIDKIIKKQNFNLILCSEITEIYYRDLVKIVDKNNIEQINYYKKKITIIKQIDNIIEIKENYIQINENEFPLLSKYHYTVNKKYYVYNIDKYTNFIVKYIDDDYVNIFLEILDKKTKYNMKAFLK